MPAYDYLCPRCGPFTLTRPMAEFQMPQPCEGCGIAAPRAMLTAPLLAGMDAGRRAAFATNEKSASAPIRSSQHGAACGCCTGRGRLRADAVPAKGFPAQRPWMIGH